MSLSLVQQPPPGLRNGQWVRFEFDLYLEIVVVDGPNVYRGPLEDREQIDSLIGKIQKSADGRFVGIHVGAHSGVAFDQVAKLDEDGQPVRDEEGREVFEKKQRDVYMPSCVAPQRAVLGSAGQQNLEMIHNGKVVTILLPLDSLRNVEALMLREDIPAHRNETLDENWNPKPADAIR